MNEITPTSLARVLDPPCGTVVAAVGKCDMMPRLRILQSAYEDEGAYFPAQSIDVGGLKAIASLAEFCDRILEESKAYEDVTRPKPSPNHP